MTFQTDPWLICSLYNIEMEENLRKNDLFFAFENATNKLVVALKNQEIIFFDSNEGVFAKEVIHRLLEESSGYLADLKQGAFFAANHHMRALIELFATTALIDSDNDKKNRFLERFIRFKEIELHKIYHKHKNSIIDFSKDILEKYFHQYKELKDDLLEIFHKDTKEQLLEMDSWRGNCKIKNLFELLPDNKVHIKNYDKLCLFTHFSSFARRSESQLFPIFTSSNEQMLAITIKYTLDSYFYLRHEKFLNEESIKKLDEVFSPIAPALMPKLELLTTK